MGRQKLKKRKRERVSVRPKTVELWPVNFAHDQQVAAYIAAYIRFKVDSGSTGDPFQGRIINYFIMADEKPVGIIAAWRSGNDWTPSKVEIIFVHKNYQRRGIARRVVNLLVSMNPDVEFLGPLTADSEGLLRSMGLMHLMKTSQEDINETHALVAYLNKSESESCSKLGHRSDRPGKPCSSCKCEWVTQALFLTCEGFFAIADIAERSGFSVCQLGDHLEDEYKDGNTYHFTPSMVEKLARQMKADGVTPDPRPPRRISAP